MNQSLFKGNWEIIKGKIMQQWGKLTHDDLVQIEGKNHEIYGKLQKAYNLTEEEAKEAVNAFLRDV